MNEDRRDIVLFLRGEPKEWTTVLGQIFPDEQQERLKFAERFARDRLKAWLQEHSYDLQGLIVICGSLNRQEFAHILVGDWIP